MSIMQDSPEEKKRKEDFLLRNRQRYSKIEKHIVENFLGTLKIENWDVLNILFSCCGKCESENISISLEKDEIGKIACVTCMKCHNVETIILETDLLL